MGKKSRKIEGWKAFPYDLDVEGKAKEHKRPRFSQIYHNQITHKSFLTLSNSAKILYVYMRDYAVDKQTFNFPKRIYKTFMTTPTFIKAKNELIEHGLIEEVENGKFTRQENTYKFLNNSNWIAPPPATNIPNNKANK